MSFWNNDKYLSGLLTDDDLGPTEPPKPTVKVQTNGLYSTSGIGAFDVDVPQGTVPSGTLPITENGTYDVTRYSSAEVDVPHGITPSGTLPITENGTYDVTEYASADVDVPQGITPSGSVTLTSENTYDVTSKASAVVDFSATRANLAEAVTAKGVDTLPTSSFDTIATNIGLIEGGGLPIPSNWEVDSGTFTLPSDIESSYTITHNLGKVPTFFLYFAKNSADLRALTGTHFGGAIRVFANKKTATMLPCEFLQFGFDCAISNSNSTQLYGYIFCNNGAVTYNNGDITAYVNNATSNSVTILATSSATIPANVEFVWKAVYIN